MLDIKPQIQDLNKIIAKNCNNGVILELELFVTETKDKYYELAKVGKFFRPLYLDGISSINERLSYNFANYIWKDLVLDESKFKDYISLVNSIVNEINNFSSIEAWFDFLPYNDEFSDYFNTITGEGYLFKLKNGQYCFLVLTGMD
jgi:hypothetical protein